MIKRKTIAFFLVIILIIAAGVGFYYFLNRAQAGEENVFCVKFKKAADCDLRYCRWGLLTECAVPGENCGFAYTGQKECLPKK